MSALPSNAVLAKFGDELAAVIGALLETNAVARRADAGPASVYVVSVEAVRGGRGSLQAYFDRSGARALSQRLHAESAEQGEDAWLNGLKEVCGQAAASLVDKHPSIGARLAIASVQSTEDPVPGSAVFMEIVLDGEADPLRLALAGNMELGEVKPDSAPTPAASHPGLEMILDINLPLVVRLGRTEMSLKALTALGPGSLIDFGRSPDEPVDVIVSNQVVAKGEVVVVAGHYGVRIRDVVSAAERVRSMEVGS